MTRLNVYLHFNGNCKEAMTFYKECLGGELKLMTVGDSPAAEHMPDMKDQIMHGTLGKDGMMIMASDMTGPDGIVPGTVYSLSISGDAESGDEIKDYYEKLSQGGKVNHEWKEEWFGTYGDVTDKFGISWMFQVDSKVNA